MKKTKGYGFLMVVFVVIVSVSSTFCKRKMDMLKVPKEPVSYILSFDSTLITGFYAKYPKLVSYKKQVISLYIENNYDFIWYDKKGRKETADVIYNRLNNLEDDGVQAKLPYKEVLDRLLEKGGAKPDIYTELFLSNYYFFYVNKTLKGIDKSKSEELGWYLPRKKQSYVGYLDSLLVNPKIIDKKERHIAQYYKLKTVLQTYRELEKKGGWKSIVVPDDFESINPGDSSAVVSQIRTRLFLTGDIAEDSGNQLYGFSLQQAVMKYKKRNGFLVNKKILPAHIKDMNVTVSERIKTIIINMERCRWISTDVTKGKEFIVVNIPSYKLNYFKEGKVVLDCNVVVGTKVNKTIIFSGMMSYIVFSPYWNITPHIIKTEILPAMKKDENYLENHNMEWNNGAVRQKPGLNNSLGLVKFLFPNSNNIYLHDTPSKSLFNSEKRAFSHGCIRVEKPKELAQLILENDPRWTSEEIDSAMHKGTETWQKLKQKIPVYIGYFTAVVDENGDINFYKDIYDKDPQLAAMLVEE
jgi:murein L,D-transpeptidase YcbB/YkuD